MTPFFLSVDSTFVVRAYPTLLIHRYIYFYENTPPCLWVHSTKVLYRFETVTFSFHFVCLYALYVDFFFRCWSVSCECGCGSVTSVLPFSSISLLLSSRLADTRTNAEKKGEGVDDKREFSFLEYTVCLEIDQHQQQQKTCT